MYVTVQSADKSHCHVLSCKLTSDAVNLKDRQWLQNIHGMEENTSVYQLAANVHPYKEIMFSIIIVCVFNK